jgi:hypothetical protein
MCPASAAFFARSPRAPRAGSPVARFQHEHLLAPFDQVRRRGQTRRSGTHHNDWRLVHRTPLASKNFESVEPYGPRSIDATIDLRR